MVETRDSEHAADMVRGLKERYTKLTFTGSGGALGVDIGSESEEDDDDSGYGVGLSVPGDTIRRRSQSRRSASRRRPSIYTTQHY